MKTIRNSVYPPVYHGRPKSSQPSLTIPDQTMSLRTILDRYARGMPLTGYAGAPVYDGEAELPDIRKMDLTELRDFKTKIQDDIKRFGEQQARDMEEAQTKAKQLQERLDQLEKAEKDRQNNQP